MNLRIFAGLIKELRIKYDIYKEGLAPDKVMRNINFGLSSDFFSQGKKPGRDAAKRKSRIENIVFQEFNMINMARVMSALQGE